MKHELECGGFEISMYYITKHTLSCHVRIRMRLYEIPDLPSHLGIYPVVEPNSTTDLSHLVIYIFQELNTKLIESCVDEFLDLRRHLVRDPDLDILKRIHLRHIFRKFDLHDFNFTHWYVDSSSMELIPHLVDLDNPMTAHTLMIYTQKIHGRWISV